MKFDPKTYLALAEYLVSCIDDLPDNIGAESARRTALNRYYYSLSTGTHLLLSNHISDQDWQNEPNKTHGFLRKRLRAEGSREARLLYADLGRLFEYRRNADYDYPLSMGDLRMMVRTQKHLAKKAQEKLDLLLASNP